jgi:hypothetical protein
MRWAYPPECDTLARLGRKIVAHQRLTPEVHPGYRKLQLELHLIQIDN